MSFIQHIHTGANFGWKSMNISELYFYFIYFLTVEEKKKSEGPSQTSPWHSWTEEIITCWIIDQTWKHHHLPLHNRIYSCLFTHKKSKSLISYNTGGQLKGSKMSNNKINSPVNVEQHWNRFYIEKGKRKVQDVFLIA